MPNMPVICAKETKIFHFMHFELNMRQYAQSSWFHFTRSIMNHKDITYIPRNN